MAKQPSYYNLYSSTNVFYNPYPNICAGLSTSAKKIADCTYITNSDGDYILLSKDSSASFMQALSLSL